jgi:ABC-type transporter MlaC component
MMFSLFFSSQSKIAGAEWKEMSAEQKAKYEAMAKDDKQRYAKAMEDYSPPDDGKKGGAKGKKKKKDPNAPKRGMTAFMYFSNEMRPKVKAENPDLSFGDMGKKLGEMFRGLTPEEKRKYEKKAEDDKDRYKKEQADYAAKQKEDADGVHDNDDDDDDDDENDSE